MDVFPWDFVDSMPQSARWPGHLSSTNNMNVKMIHWLSTITSIIDHWNENIKQLKNYTNMSALGLSFVL